jgi:hemolysin III
MLTAVAETQPSYTFGEEFCNVITHGSACAFALYKLLTYKPEPESNDALCEAPMLPPNGKRVLLFSFMVLFLNSTLYHGFLVGPFKAVFRSIDHFSVVLTMLGTTAPLMFHGLPRAWAITAVLTLMSVIGAYICFAIVSWVKFEEWEVRLYFPFATVCCFLTAPGFRKMDRASAIIFAKGVLVYLCGVPFFIRDDVRYAHSIFHCAVAIGGYYHWRAVMG